MNKHGMGSGLALALILIVALIVAFLAVKQIGGLRGDSARPGSSQGKTAVQQTLDVVDQFNAAKQKTLDMLENPGGEG